MLGSSSSLVVHALETETGEEPARPRAKAIARPERAAAVRIFRAAVEASPLSQRQIARRLQVDEHTLRRYLSGEASIPFEKVALLPPRSEEVAGRQLCLRALDRAIVVQGEPSGEGDK